MLEKRTDIDFSKHELEVIKTEEVLIHKLKIPQSSFNAVIFINSCGVMSVTGDFGNWIFCREFHPDAGTAVSDQYWIEKLKISSSQQPYKYDAEETGKEIRTLLDEEGDLDTEEKEYLEQCIEESWYEHGYISYAYQNNCGRFEDSEYVPFKQKLNHWLLYIFDAFDEICTRLNTQNSE